MTDPQSKAAQQATQAFEVLRRTAAAPSPFVQVLLSCLERRATGSLSVLLSGRGRLWVRIEGGFPTAVAGDGLADSVLNTLLPLCTLQQGGYAFQDGEDRTTPLPGMLRGRIDPHALLAEAFRHASRATLIQRQVSLSDVRLLAVARGVNLARYRFTDDERRVADRLMAGTTSVAALASERDLNASVVRRVVYVLEVTGALLDLKTRDESGRRAKRSSQPPAPQVPEGLPDDPRESYARPVASRAPAAPPQVAAEPPSRVVGPAGRVRSPTLAFGALPMSPHAPPGALPPPPSVPAPQPLAKAAAGTGTLLSAGGPRPSRPVSPLESAATLLATPRPEPTTAVHPIATPPARRRQQAPAGGYSMARPEHGEHTLEAPRARKDSSGRGSPRPARDTPVPPSDGEASAGLESAPLRLLSLPMPSVGLSAMHRARWHEVLDRYRRLQTEDHFLALGVPRTVDLARLDTSFRSESARFQPMHLPPELAPVRPHAEAIVEALHRAYDVLREPGRRQAYLKKLAAR
jgi:hypothetical protein